METCQRNIYGDIIPETAFMLLVALVVDSSARQGTYSQRTVEKAVNTFFKTISNVKDADDLIEICVYESHDEVELLGGFRKASTLKLEELRYGGNWNLPNGVAQAIGDVADYSLMLVRRGYALARPLILAISDNRTDEDNEAFRLLEEVVADKASAATLMPHCVLVSSGNENYLGNHVPTAELRQAQNETLSSCMRAIAQEMVSVVRPRQIPERDGFR